MTSPGTARGALGSASFWVFLFLVLLGGVAWPSLSGPFANQRILAQGALLLSGIAWAALVWISLKYPRFLCGSAGKFWVLGGALLLRAAVGLGDPMLSDDVHRYVWEGGLVGAGVSPYTWAPEAPELEPYRERWGAVFGRMNNRDVSAAYPPVAQLAFAGITSLAGGPAADDGLSGVRGMRWAFCGFDLAVLALLLWRFREQPSRALIWGWSPLVALEFAGSAHFDSLGILFFLAALLSFEARRGFSVHGYALLALGMLVKFLPLLAFPFSARDRRDLLKAGFCLAAVFGLGFLPLYWLDGSFSGLTSGLAQYALRWESFSILFRPIEWSIETLLELDRGGLDARRYSRVCILVMMSLVLLWAWWKRRGPVSASFYLIGGFLLLTPTLHPWYLTWLIPLLAFRPSMAWTLLVVLAPMLYWPLTEWQARGEWIEPVWLWPIVALPFCALLLAESCGLWPAPVNDVTTLN